MIAVDILTAIAVVMGVSLLATGVLRLILVPFAIAFEVHAGHRRRQRHEGRRKRGELRPEGSVSIIVPCYNEGRVLERCVVSMAEHIEDGTEIILVDDGSTDDTLQVARSLAQRYSSVQVIAKANGGKGSALNAGIRVSTGDFLILTDADGIWLPESIEEILLGFADPRVGAVCGDDRTVNLDRVQTKFMTLISHVGTGLMRRAFSVLRCLPVVSGNSGAFRREAIAEVGLLREDSLGEDLELTWRVQRSRWRVVFRPRAIVYAESPSTLRDLWKQRVRWARGLFQSIGQHWSAVGNPRYGMFGLSLLPLAIGSVMLPLAQIVVLPVIVALALLGDPAWLPGDWLAWLLWLSLPVAAALCVLSCGLDRAWGDLRFAWLLPLWPLFSFWMSAVMLAGLWLELRGVDRAWNKLERRGVVSIKQTEAGA